MLDQHVAHILFCLSNLFCYSDMCFSKATRFSLGREVLPRSTTGF